MKKLVLLSCLFTLFYTQLIALAPDTPAPLYEHLVEINRQWLKVVPGQSLLEQTTFTNDQARIATHLRLLEQMLRQRIYPAFNAKQRANRLRHLDALHAYHLSGVFPTNHYHLERRPYFRDNNAVLCAVGYLLWEDDQHELVDRINRGNNYGYLFDLSRQYPEIEVWATENGFLLEELAWIQPAYEPIKPDFSLWGNGQGLNPGGQINIMAKTPDETKLIVAGAFSSIDGQAFNNIAVWDGAGWLALGAGVIGEVFALDVYHLFGTSKLLVGGKFYLPGQPELQNVAEYDFNSATWKGLQTGDMGGSVYAVHYNSGFPGLYIGGDFQKINGIDHPYIGHWHPYNNGVWNYYFDYLNTDGPVKTLADVDGLMLVGGSFEKVKNADTGNWEPAPHLVYFRHSYGWIPLIHNLPAVERATYFEGNIFAAHPFKLKPDGKTEGLSVLKAGLWYEQSVWPYADSTIHGFCPYNNYLMVFGGLQGGSINGGFGTGMIHFQDDNLTLQGVTLADATIRAAQSFQGFMYVAGDFEHLFGTADPYDGMARFTLPYVSSPEPDRQLAIEVTASAKRLRCRYEALNYPTELRIFDLQGRLVTEVELLPGGETILDVTAEWNTGLYVWQLQNQTGMQAGKWAVQN
ncbi:MAG: hypothetical protein H6569_08785 [Lewinellaceae bacterium]|nr:hypothetical protein [Lewinellaceae bacterium]